MSYDLMVFAPDAAPRGHVEFMRWYKAQSAWEENHAYNDPAVSTPALRAWFMEMIEIYPALNGPWSKAELPDDENTFTDYSIGETVIYACFAWSKAEQAYNDMFGLCAKHSLGFFNVSSASAEVWLPDGGGALLLAHSG